MRTAIYARYSSDNQRAASIEDQVRQCTKWIEKEGHTVVEVYSDHAISGASTMRPGYQKMLEDARNGTFDILIAEALDRLSRDQENIAGLFKQLSFAGIQIFTLSEGEISELHVGLKGTMNALFLKDLAQKTRRGLEGRVRQGKSGGGNAYGYDVVKKVDANGEPIRGDRAINETEAVVINRIFRDFTQGLSPRAIAKSLNSEGIPGPGSKYWRDTTIRGHHTRRTGILRNDLYVGTLIWNKQRYVKDPNTGKRLARPNPKEDWVIEQVPGLRIINQDLWDHALERLDGIRNSASVVKARETKFWEHRRAKHLFTGLMVCAECGGSMIAAGKDYMACDHARNQGTCKNKRGIRRHLIEETVIASLKSNLMQPDHVAEFIKAFNDEIHRLQKERGSGQEQKAKELAKINKKLEGLYDAIADGLRTQGLKVKLEELEAQKGGLETEIKTTPAQAPYLHPNLSELYRRKVEHLHDSLNNSDARTEAAEILRSLVEHIEVKNTEDGFEIELEGQIVNMIQAAQSHEHKGKAASNEAASLKNYASSVKVVAGARNYLDKHQYEHVSLIITGGLRTPADFVKALCLGADGIALSNAAMQAIGCVAARMCNTNHCPAGIATQRPELRQQVDPGVASQRLARFLGSSVALMKLLARACGHRHFSQFSVRDLTTWKKEMSELSGVRFGGVSGYPS